MAFHVKRWMTENMVYIWWLIDFWGIVLTLKTEIIAKNSEIYENEDPVIVLIIFILLLIPVLFFLGVAIPIPEM